MKLKFKLYCCVVLFLAMTVAPALAQFEVTPDHFGDRQTDSRNAASVNPASLQKQIAVQTSLLASYHHQIADQVTAVEQSWRLLISPEGSADEAGESIALSVNQKRLAALVRFLEDPIRVAEANLASLETKQAALMAPAKDHPPAVRHVSRRQRVLMASSPSGSAEPVKHAGASPGSSEGSTKDAESVKHTIALNH